jgi:hypothetical protein
MYVCVCMKLNAHDEVSKEKAMKAEICREPPEKSPQQTPVKDGVPIYPITPRMAPTPGRFDQSSPRKKKVPSSDLQRQYRTRFVSPPLHLARKKTVVRTRLSSSVHTLRAHNLIFLGGFSPACFNSTSIPSHQHLRFGSRHRGKHD